MIERGTAWRGERRGTVGFEGVVGVGAAGEGRTNFENAELDGWMDGWTDGEGMKIMGNDFDLEEVYTVCVCVCH